MRRAAVYARALAGAPLLAAAQPEPLGAGVVLSPTGPDAATTLHVPVVVAPASATIPTAQAFGKGANSIRVAEFVVGTEAPTLHQQESITAFRQEHGRLPKTFEAAGWDALRAAAGAFERAGPEASHAQVCHDLREPYRGVLGDVAFSAPDLAGLSLRSFVFSRVAMGSISRLPYRYKGEQALAQVGSPGTLRVR